MTDATIKLTQREDGKWVAENSETSTFWTDETPILALLGLTVFNAVDDTLPYDDSSAEAEDARYGLWKTISQGVMNALRPSIKETA